MAETITDRWMQGKAAAADRWLVEAGARGEGRLVGRITPAGERRFYFRYTGSGSAQVRLPIGAYDPRGDGAAAFTVQQARDKAREWSALYRSGIRDLREHLQQQIADARRAADEARASALERDRLVALEKARRLTVRDLFDRWVKTELKPQQRADGRRTGRKDGGAYTRAQFERHVFPSIGAMAIDEVRKADLMAILDAQRAAGKLRTANVLLADLKQMLRFALARDLVPKNPLDTVTKRDVGGAEVERERVLSASEIGRLAELLPVAGLNRRTELAVWAILATGCRVGELMGATWDRVDMLARTWHLPDTKNQREHTIHLSAFALRQFEALADLKEAGVPRRKSLLRSTKPKVEPVRKEEKAWVFPNTKGTAPVDVKSFGKQLADRQRPASDRMKNRSKNTAALELAGGRWTAHDLRRTAATVMAELGISGDVIDECLNHKIESRVRRTYVRDRRAAEQVRAFDALGARLDELATGRTAAVNIVSFKAA